MLGVALVQHFRAPVLPTDAVTFAGGRFFLGRRRLPRWELLWKLEWFDRVFDYCSQLLRRTQAAKLASQMLEGSLRTEQQVPRELRCWLGFSGTEPAVFDLVQQGPHSLVIGPTGVGKSQLIRLMLHGLTTSLNPAELRLCLIDFKGGATLGEWFEHPSTQAAATDLDSSYEPVLNWLGQQLELRKLLDRAKGILIDEHQMSEQDAFNFIQKTAMSRRLKMQQVAEGVLDRSITPND